MAAQPKKYSYYIFDTFNGCVKGTDSAKIAEELATCEDYFVVDATTGEWMQTCNRRVPVKRQA